MTRRQIIAAGMVVLVAALSGLKAEDWPEVQGKGRRSVWYETGLLNKFPAQGLTIRWRTPINAGYSGPAVADGRVFISDYRAPQGGPAVERALGLDERTGEILWTYENPGVSYGKVAYPYGPRATPTVDGNNVYVLGAAGDLFCLDAASGQLNWKVNFPSDFHAKTPMWGYASAPVVHGDLLICLANADDGMMVALNRRTGKEVWRAMAAENDPGYSPPVLFLAGGVDQLIQWHTAGITSLDPNTGKPYWEQLRNAKMAIATPAREGNWLFVTSFFNGPLMMEMDPDKPQAKMLWQGDSNSEIKTDGLHSTMSTPAIKDGYIYGVCSYGQFRCLDARTGKRMWETQEVTVENARWATAFLVRNGERFFINNDRGELIIAELSPQGYREISRTQLIKPTTPGGGKRELGAVNWVLPAYANKHILIRNDEEIISASLESPATTRPAAP